LHFPETTRGEHPGTGAYFWPDDIVPWVCPCFVRRLRMKPI
jgi:hypothetical protein